MRFGNRSLTFVFPSLLVVAVMFLVLVSTTSAATPTVTMFDNDAAGMGFAPEQALWGFAPATLTVTAGQSILFVNPESSQHPHAVTSLERTGGPFANQMKVGGRFDSSPDQSTLLMPGQTYTLDTTPLQPGNYAYYCKIHPWMVAAFTVTGAAQ